jgi:hypothetical protein
MSNLTALQQAMRIVEQYAPQLFDTYNANGRAFIDEMTKLLDVEREQMGLPNCKPMDEQIISVTILDSATGKTYTRKTHGLEETYKRGEQ